MSGDITAEATARENADTALEGKIENLWAKNYRYQGTQIVGHGGCGTYAPYNTRFAFDLAVSLYADAIETDVQITSDHIPVCSHNPVVNGTILKETPWSSVRNIVVSSANSQHDDLTIPSLEQFLTVCKSGNKTAIIEFKWEAEHHMVVDDLQYVKQVIDNCMYDNVIFISWVKEPLTAYLALDPQAKCMVLLGDPLPVTNEQILDAKNSGYYGVGIPVNSYGMEFTDYAHSIGLRVNLFTASAYPTNAHNWFNHFVDYITTDSIITCGDRSAKTANDYINAHGSNNGIPMMSKYMTHCHGEGYPLLMETVSRNNDHIGGWSRFYSSVSGTVAVAMPIPIKSGDVVIKNSWGGATGHAMSILVWTASFSEVLADSGWLSGQTTYTIPANLTSATWITISYRKGDQSVIDYNDLYSLWSTFGGIIRAAS